MDVVDLPLLGADTAVQTAIDAMNVLNRRKVIVTRELADHVVYSNKVVLQGWREGIATLGQLEGGDRVVALLAYREFRTESAMPGDYSAIEMALDQALALYGVLRTDPRRPGGVATATIVTRYETLTAEARSSTKECVCSLNASHNAQHPPAPGGGGKCPFGDSGTWQCA